jgi:hypothetical protein
MFLGIPYRPELSRQLRPVDDHGTADQRADPQLRLAIA